MQWNLHVRVVMLSWEFPPKRVGGIAAALEGLAPAVASQDCIVDVITAGDAGGALGAAQAAFYMYFDQERTADGQNDAMEGAYLGPDYSDKEAILAFRKLKAVYRKVENYSDLCSEVTDLLDQGNVIGWFQGRMEFGPRALGNRSILGDARNVEMQKKINLKIKYREGFRPFAPSVSSKLTLEPSFKLL